MYVDPSGHLSVFANLNELMAMAQAYNLLAVAFAQDASQRAKDLANDYADQNGYYSVKKVLWWSKKEYIVWDNAADALRHMSWNSIMAREMGMGEALFAANNHEYFALKENGWVYSQTGNVIETKMNQPTLMDLWNNQVGRILGGNPNLSTLTDRQLFDYAVENNMLILDATTTYEFYNVSDYINTEDWTVNVIWDLDKNTLTFVKDGLSDFTVIIGQR